MKASDIHNQRGAVALMTVIIMGALLLVIGLSSSYIGQTEVIIAGQLDRGQHARTRATACVEEAFHRLKLDSGYSGGSINIEDIICIVTVAGAGSTRTVTASASSGDFNKTIEVSALLMQNADTDALAWTISSWQEVNP